MASAWGALNSGTLQRLKIPTYPGILLWWQFQDCDHSLSEKFSNPTALSRLDMFIRW
jgi:hypothetical protein